MSLPELGEPDESFDVWEEDDGSQSLGAKRGHPYPGFNKWTVQESSAGNLGGHNYRELELSFSEDGPGFYCDEAEVHFTGKLVDGTEFVSTKQNGVPLRFILGQENVMKGFNLAVSSMKPGERAIFSIPPELAVTKTGSPASIPSNIPPNQIVQFDVELISLFTIIDIFRDEDLLKKTIKCATSDRREPRTYDVDLVYVKYNVCLKDGTSVSKSDGVEFSLSDGFFCPAFTHAVKTMKEGEEAILIVNPKYAFDELGRPSQGDEVAVPPDATLYVYLKFVSWIRQIGEDPKILKKTLSVGDSPGTRTQSQAVVKARLFGKLQDGTVFDQRGHDEEELFEFVVDEGFVVDGLDEAVMTMEEGEVAEFTIPPQHAYGALGCPRSTQHGGVIPANSFLIYKIELLSVVNEKHPLDIMNRNEVIASACIKEKEGDSYFNLGQYLRAHRRYYKARQIIQYSRYCKAREIIPYSLYGEEELDTDLKEMVISFAFKAAKCAIHLQCYSEACNSYHEVLRYEPENVEAKQMVAREYPQDSPRVDIHAMRRGFVELIQPEDAQMFRLLASYPPRLKHGHSYSGRNIFIPGVAAPVPNASRAVSTASSSHATVTPAAQNAGTIRTDRGFLFRCFGSSTN